MTENVQLNELQNQNQNTNVDANNYSSAPAQEKMLRQSEVNEIIGREKKASYEKGRLDELAAKQASNQSFDQSANTQQNASQQYGSAPNSPEQIQALIAQQLRQHQEQMYMHQVAQNLISKAEEAKKRYNDFDEVTNKVDFRKMPEMLLLANETDNAGDVLYDLAKNPSKIGTILALAQRDPSLARAEISQLSQSIKQNLAAKDQPKVNSPLSHVQASNVGTDSGSLTIKDMRRQPWAR